MNNTSSRRELSPEQRERLLRALQARFEKNMAAGMSATIAMGRKPGSQPDPRITPLTWRPPWALSF